MWINKSEADDEHIFNSLIEQCKHTAPQAQLSFSVRNRLEKLKKDVRKKIVSRTMDGCAPLFIASKRGHLEIVEYLITVCNADIEQRGRYQVLDDRSVHCVTPLWCAAVSGKLPVIKCLISHGADVNAASDSGSTPVRSACFMTHMDIVSFLVENGADILIANYNGGTCLINSVQSVELCTFLLQHGADVNAPDIQNKTALHYAIQEHRLETAKLLLEHNANPHLRSRQNDDALQTACLKGAAQIFEYLVEKIDYSPERLANANELMGSTFFDDHNDTLTALSYWRTAMTIRNNHPHTLPKRPIMPKRETYRNATEFSTLEELSALVLDLDAIRIQSLLICERIIGTHHKDTLFRLMYRGASYADALRFQHCIDLWRRALEIRIEKDSILYIDTCFTAEALVRLMVDLYDKSPEMMDHNRDKEEPRFSDVVAIFKLLSSQLIEVRNLLEIRPVYKRQRESYDRILRCVTHLIYLLVVTANNSEKKEIIRKLVHDLVKQNPRSAQTEDTLLHLCVSRLNTIDSSYLSAADDVQKVFPHVGVVELLLECGAYVNAQNEARCTPLHIASNTYNFNNHLIKLLLDHGAHLDVPNKSGDTPAFLISSNHHNTVNLVNYMSLQCYAAQVIHKYGIRCTELPISLHHFLEFHKH